MSFAGENARVEIVAVPKSGNGPIWVHLSPKIRNLNEPVKLEWSFGDGKTSNEKQPGFYLFEFGQYSVVLEVTDNKGKKYTASVTIDASSPG